VNENLFEVNPPYWLGWVESGARRPPAQVNVPQLPLYYVGISVTLSKHFGHLWEMMMAIKRIAYWLNGSFNTLKRVKLNI